VPRTDGRAALLVYLYPQGKSRSYFFGALAADIVEAPALELIPRQVVLTEQALLHIKCFKENDTPVAGNIIDRIDPAILIAMNSAAQSGSVGSISRVWGHITIVTKANAIAV
jgi:hypothetical protein